MFSITTTTRQPRSGEVDGKDYFFISKEEFKEKIQENHFIEYASIFDNYYGTPIGFIKKTLYSGNNVLFAIDWQGMRRIKATNMFNISTLFLIPPSIDVLRSRLKNRGDSAEQVEKRISGFKNDAEKANEYDYIIVNDDLEETCRKVQNIYQAQKIKFQKEKQLSFINKVLIDLYV